MLHVGACRVFVLCVLCCVIVCMCGVRAHTEEMQGPGWHTRLCLVTQRFTAVIDLFTESCRGGRSPARAGWWLFRARDLGVLSVSCQPLLAITAPSREAGAAAPFRPTVPWSRPTPQRVEGGVAGSM